MRAKDKKPAMVHLKDGVYIDRLLEKGVVPPVKDLDARLKTTDNAGWTTYVHGLASNAKSFQLSWDRAPPELGNEPLTHLDQLFLGEASPQRFCARMGKVRRSQCPYRLRGPVGALRRR
ncbi:hypothetical protein [Streptomyces guryensis]|uniref:Uncharacterized protein n=1 Tax=Streptomyces guryensis TaxID=2886947 RepID=A0A9Q3VVC9_9ACTN|nr:hypothetical protein [Streptomyces guryensis]MCD9878462.1 hypothetical protein [Streptomyces guryensis]